MSKKVRIGFIGCGGIARLHMTNLANIPDAEMVAFCDVDAGRAQEVANQYSGRAYTSHREMLEKEELDGIIVAVPPFAHGDIEEALVEYDGAVFMEKPIALDVEFARRIAKEVEARGRLWAVGYHLRYSSLTQMVKEVLPQYEVSSAIGYWLGNTPGVQWWWKMEESGGQIVEQTTHIFDLARYLLGEIEAVSGFGSSGLMRELEGYNIYDSSFICLHFESGVTAAILSSHVIDAYYKIGLDIICKGPVIELRPERLRIVKHDHIEEYPRFHDNPHGREMVAFVEAVKTGDRTKILSTYGDAVRTLQVTIAANEAMATGGVVKIS